MDNRPIGFFDSGLGGLTCIPFLHQKLPDEKVIYYGDTARTPYGSKSTDTIKKFSSQIVGYLVSSNVKMIVIACNTVTATAIDDLREEFPHIPIIGVIEPMAKTIAGIECKEVGVIGTKVTIKSEVYPECIHKFNDSVEVHSLACPAIVPLIEEDIVNNEIMDLTVKYYMDNFVKENKLKNLILGCTHYPIIEKNIKKIYPELKLFNPSKEVINEVEKTLADKDMFAEKNDNKNICYASDLSENFIRMIDRLFEGSDTKIELKKFEE